MAITDTPFWMVWNPSGRPPAYRHPSEGAAIAEAERLAIEQPGQTFIVLGTVCARRVEDMRRIDMRPPTPDNDRPF